MSRPCKHCDSTEHTSFYCFRKPRGAIKTRKPINKIGPTTRQWLALRSEWLRENPPNHMGYYVCYLCGKWVDYTEITLDHVLSRSRRPDLVLEKSNLKPACSACNMDKGSK